MFYSSNSLKYIFSSGTRGLFFSISIPWFIGSVQALIFSSGFHTIDSQRRLWEDAFFLEATDPIGGAELCPRDGRPGCAMVDVLERQHRRQCNPASMEKGENKGGRGGHLKT